MSVERGYDRFLRGYDRLLLHIVKWWAVGAIFVTTVILACILLDWLGHIGWGYPWHSLPLTLALVAFAVLVRRAAINTLARF